MTYRTKYPTTGKLSDGSGRAPRMVEVPAGTLCRPTGDGAYFADGWTTWGDETLAKGTLGDHDATYRGIRVQGVHIEATP